MSRAAFYRNNEPCSAAGAIALKLEYNKRNTDDLSNHTNNGFGLRFIATFSRHRLYLQTNSQESNHRIDAEIGHQALLSLSLSVTGTPARRPNNTQKETRRPIPFLSPLLRFHLDTQIITTIINIDSHVHYTLDVLSQLSVNLHLPLSDIQPRN